MSTKIEILPIPTAEQATKLCPLIGRMCETSGCAAWRETTPPGEQSRQGICLLMVLRS